MCGSDPYNPDEHFCCEGTLAGPGDTCCGGIVYRTGTEGLDNGECCGGVEGFNPATDICCDDFIYPRENEGKCYIIQ